MRKKIAVCVVAALIVIAAVVSVVIVKNGQSVKQAEDLPQTLEQRSEKALGSTLKWLKQQLPEASFGSVKGDWTVFVFARESYLNADDAYYKKYLENVKNEVDRINAEIGENGRLHRSKSTENSRLTIALSALGEDSRNVSGIDILKPLEDLDYAAKQGVNGAIFALIAFDAKGYDTENPDYRRKLVDFILSKQLEDGGWAMMGTSSDADVTAEALTALSAYIDDERVNAAAQKGIETLSNLQCEDGSFRTLGKENCESTAQVIVACSSLGIDAGKDERFIKNGVSALEALLTYYTDEGAFSHLADSKAEIMSSNQAAYALISYKMFLKGEGRLYDMN